MRLPGEYDHSSKNRRLDLIEINTIITNSRKKEVLNRYCPGQALRELPDMQHTF